MTVDTLRLARELRASELPQQQAEAIAAAIGLAVMEGAATKADVDQASLRLESKIEQLRSQLVTWFVGTQVAVGALVVALIKL